MTATLNERFLGQWIARVSGNLVALDAAGESGSLPDWARHLLGAALVYYRTVRPSRAEAMMLAGGVWAAYQRIPRPLLDKLEARIEAEVPDGLPADFEEN